MKCPDCEHPPHEDESCQYIPWDGNPYGFTCECPPADARSGYCCPTLAGSGVCSCPDREQLFGW